MLKHLPQSIRLVEVGPRDGLQNEKTIINLEDKFNFIKNLAAAGLKEIEASSFVRAEKIPQMQDSAQLFDRLIAEPSLKNTHLISLVPNLIGMKEALVHGVKDIAVFTSTSNSFNKKNINSTIDESLLKIEEVLSVAKTQHIRTRGYISTVFGCPYEGKTSLTELKRIALRLKELGVYEISLGDTIGIANPKQVQEVIEFLSVDFPLDFFSMHFHDTRGMAIANVLTSLELGIGSFDSSAGGLGGCPYAVGASGNVATEDLVYLFESMGIKTGVDLDKLIYASELILAKLGNISLSKSHTAYVAAKK